MIAWRNPGSWGSRSAAQSSSSESAEDREPWSLSNGFASIRPRRRGIRARSRLPSRPASKANLATDQIKAVGIGFGGPVDAAQGRTQKSYQIAGWDDFPLSSFIREHLGVPLVVLENDADAAGLAESRFGAGLGYSPLLYMNVGSGIGGALIVDDRIYRGSGQGATEIGHLRVPDATAAGGTDGRIGTSGLGLGNRFRRTKAGAPYDVCGGVTTGPC